MRKSASIDTTVGASGQENQLLGGSRVHNSRARNNRHGHTDDLRAENVRQKKSSVSSFGSSLDSIKVSSESQADQADQAHQAHQAHQAQQAERQTHTHQAERQKKFSLCTGSSYDSQMSSVDKQSQQGRSRQRKLSLCLPSTQQPASLSSPKVQQWHSSTVIKVHFVHPTLPFFLFMSNAAWNSQHFVHYCVQSQVVADLEQVQKSKEAKQFSEK